MKTSILDRADNIFGVPSVRRTCTKQLGRCTRTGDRVVVSRHGIGDVQFPHVEDLDVVVDASAHHLLVVPRQAHGRHLVLVHKLRHGSSHPRVPEFDEAVVRAGSDQVSRARYRTAVHYPGVALK